MNVRLLETPNPVLRFGVGDPLGACSGVWRVWAQGQRGDVYVACRPVAHAVKVSLHASGDFREAWTSAAAAAQGLPASERLRLQWHRLQPLNGWIYAYRIKIPASELRRMDHPRIPEETYWHPAPRKGRTIEFTVLIGPHALVREGFPGGEVSTLFLMGLTASNGDLVALMVHETAGSEESERQLADMRRIAVTTFREEGRSGWSNQRAIFPVVDGHGVGNAVEIAVPDDSPDSIVRGDRDESE